jgi:hypothetical protein
MIDKEGSNIERYLHSKIWFCIHYGKRYERFLMCFENVARLHIHLGKVLADHWPNTILWSSDV